jgi:hypothetical protein
MGLATVGREWNGADRSHSRRTRGCHQLWVHRLPPAGYLTAAGRGPHGRRLGTFTSTFIGTQGETGDSITIERSLLEPYGSLRAAI